MTIVNTNGMAFFGPGSEWFWTAISGLILVVTFLAIYRQLRIARSAAAYGQLDAFERELDSERMIRNELDLLVALRDRADPADVPPGAAYVIGGFWEKIAALVRSGHLDSRLLTAGSLTSVNLWWPAMAAYARRERTARVQPAFLENFEWLAGTITGIPSLPSGGEAEPSILQQEYIAILEDRLRTEEALRTVTVASPEPAIARRPGGRHLDRP